MTAFRKRAGLTQGQLAERLGVEQPTVQRWETGKREPTLSVLTEIAEALGIDRAALLSDDRVPLGPRLYVKAEVAAGVWRDAWEIPGDEWEAFTGRADLATPIRERFGLRVVGESMNEVYPPGTILECIAYDGQPIPSGKRVVVQRQREGDGYETTVKEFVMGDDGIVWLVPRSTNPAFQTPFRPDVPEPGIAHVEIIGIVVASVRPE